MVEEIAWMQKYVRGVEWSNPREEASPTTVTAAGDVRARARINAHSWASRRPSGKAREVNNI